MSIFSPTVTFSFPKAPKNRTSNCTSFETWKIFVFVSLICKKSFFFYIFFYAIEFSFWCFLASAEHKYTLGVTDILSIPAIKNCIEFVEKDICENRNEAAALLDASFRFSLRCLPERWLFRLWYNSRVPGATYSGVRSQRILQSKAWAPRGRSQQVLGLSPVHRALFFLVETHSCSLKTRGRTLLPGLALLPVAQLCPWRWIGTVGLVSHCPWECVLFW